MANYHKKFIAVLCLLVVIFAGINLSAADAAARKRKAKAKANINADANNAVLPSRGDIAVIAEGPDEHKARVETNIVDILTKRGYRVVNEAKMKAIRAAAARAQAARYALYGEFDKILKISSSYSVAATVIAHVTPGGAKENSFGLCTGTATAEIMAVKSNGIKLGGKTASSKQVGYTEEETLQKAVDDAVIKSMEQLF
ncbi:MAG: hypothetical protein IJ576_00730 [Synergistaceae bacterium]|nr:hypothetical protein [Synergistaceae bacterium]MBR1604037.1 hypothetical protein [Synergistaceae bacterium]